MTITSHITHGAAGVVGGIGCALLLAGLHIVQPTPISTPSIAGAASSSSRADKMWMIDAAGAAAALKPFHLAYVEIICGGPTCQIAADELAEAIEGQGMEADVHSPIGRVPDGLIVSAGKKNDPAVIAIAINKATGGRLPISFISWPFYKSGTITISFGRLK